MSWLDEEHLLFGDEVSASIGAAIRTETDYVLLFVDTHAATSLWVHREVAWAMEMERSLNRTILLPIVVDDGALDAFPSAEFRNRKYLQLQDFQETSVRALGRTIADALFALVCRDMQRLHQPITASAVARMTESDNIIREQASLIHKVVFPHRSSNPITKETMLEVVNTQTHAAISADEFDQILTAVLQRNLIPGFSYDGYAAFLVEEHSQWKAELNRERKERVARKAVTCIRNGMTIAIDAGSTAECLVRLLCKRIETRAITKLTVATTSVNVADMISDCCVKMGFDDDFSAVTLFVPGGRIRPNTQAIVQMNPEKKGELLLLGDRLGGFDVGIIGVNGISLSGGFTTHDNAEKVNKYDIIAASRRRLILGDSSKVGLVLDERFATFDDDLTLIINQDDDCADMEALVSRYGVKIVLA